MVAKRNSDGILVRKPEGKRPLGSFNMHKMGLKWISYKVGSVVGCCVYSNETLGSIKHGIFILAE